MFDGEKNKNNPFQSHYIAFTLSFKSVDWLTSRLPTSLFLFFVYINHRLRCICCFPSSKYALTFLSPAKNCWQSGHGPSCRKASSVSDVTIPLRVRDAPIVELCKRLNKHYKRLLNV